MLFIVPEHGGTRTVTGTVKTVAYREDRDDVVGEPVQIDVTTAAGTESIMLWADGRVPVREGDELRAELTCRDNGRGPSRCDGLFFVRGELAIIISGTGGVAPPAPWTFDVGPQGGYDENDTSIRSRHGIVAHNGSDSVVVNEADHCKTATLAGATWTVAGAVEREQWKTGDKAGQSTDAMRFSVARQ